MKLACMLLLKAEAIPLYSGQFLLLAAATL
jgi:hypothetical protein